MASIAMLVGGAAGCQTKTSDQDIRPIGLAQTRAMLADSGQRRVILLDPRAPSDFAGGHIPGARNVRLSELSGPDKRLRADLAAAKVIVVYGDDPGSAVARATAKRLLALGADEVVWFDGGIAAWEAAGYRVERSGG